MLKKLRNMLFGGKDDYTPSLADQEMVEDVRTRLMMIAGLSQTQGTVIRSIPGVIVEFLLRDGVSHATVFTKDVREVGYITPEGEIVYIRPSA